MWVLVTRGRDEAEVARLDFEFNEPPTWDLEAAPSIETLRGDADAFLTAMAANKRG